MIIEDSKILNQLEKNHIKKILFNIDFTWQDSTTTKKFPQYAHSLVKRPKFDEYFNSEIPITISSPYFSFFYSLVVKFCLKYKIKYSNIIRACINKTFHIPNYFHGDPHIDFSKEHYVILIYLSDFFSKSHTLIFDKCQKFDNMNYYLDISDSKNSLPIKKRIVPEFAKMCLFDGKYFHSNEIPKKDETRIVCVFNLLK